MSAPRPNASLSARLVALAMLPDVVPLLAGGATLGPLPAILTRREPLPAARRGAA